MCYNAITRIFILHSLLIFQIQRPLFSELILIPYMIHASGIAWFISSYVLWVFLDQMENPPAKRVRRKTKQLQRRLKNLFIDFSEGRKTLRECLRSIGYKTCFSQLPNDCCKNEIYNNIYQLYALYCRRNIQL